MDELTQLLSELRHDLKTVREALPLLEEAAAFCRRLSTELEKHLQEAITKAGKVT